MAVSNPDFAPLLRNSPIADENGNPTPFFIQWIEDFQKRVITSVDAVNTTTAAVQGAASQVVTAQTQVVSAATTAVAAQQQANQTAGNTTQGGTGTSIINVLGDGSWAHGPTVNLAGVVAGHLTLGATGPSQANASAVADGTFNGTWQVVEIIAGVETQVANGVWTASRFSFENEHQTIVVNGTDATTLSIARTTTGAVSYRLDLSMLGAEVDHVRAFLSVTRGP